MGCSLPVLTLLAVVLVTPVGGMAASGGTPEGQPDNGPNGPAGKPLPSGSEALPSQMSRETFIQQVLRRNNVVAGQDLTVEVAGEGVIQAKAAFEPVGKASLLRTSLRQKSTAEELLAHQSVDPTYVHRDKTADVDVSVLTPTGATVEGKVGLDAIQSNLQTVEKRPEEYRSYVDLSITQPLAKDGGFDVTSAKTRMAEQDRLAAGHTRDSVVASVVSSAISAYLDLRLAQERQQTWDKGLQMTERLVTEAHTMQRQGRLSESALLDVENSLSLYRVGASEAQQRLVEAMGAARNLLLLSAQETPLLATDPLAKNTMGVQPTAFEDLMRIAIQNRADYQARLATLEKEGIHVVYAQNQILPRVDLVASYGANNLEYDGGRSLSGLSDNDFPSWKVGVTASFPLGGNQGANADLRIARMNKEKALLDLKAAETAISNEIQSGLAAYQSGRERWQMYRNILDTGEKQLAMERQLFNSGRSDMRSLLAREESMVRTRVSLLEQVVAMEKAQVALDVAQGTLLTALTAEDVNKKRQAAPPSAPPAVDGH
ncbi:MAG: TolC family protein [Magnetococcales bacterium]|nr:TolC family protein [Magnetococcales bacterium]